MKKTLGKRIKQYREARKLSQRELGEKIYKSATAISKYERGLACPSAMELVELSKVLEVTPNDLLVDYLVIKEIVVSPFEGVSEPAAAAFKLLISLARQAQNAPNADYDKK